MLSLNLSSSKSKSSLPLTLGLPIKKNKVTYSKKIENNNEPVPESLIIPNDLGHNFGLCDSSICAYCFAKAGPRLVEVLTGTTGGKGKADESLKNKIFCNLLNRQIMVQNTILKG